MNLERVSIDEPAIAPQNLKSLQRFVAEETGVIVEEGKSEFFELRLAPVLEKSRIANLDVLCCLLRVSGNSGLRRAVLDAMTN